MEQVKPRMANELLGREYERKFLVEPLAIPSERLDNPKLIEHAYIGGNHGPFELRVTRKGTSTFTTAIKDKAMGDRLEVEAPISAETFAFWREHADGRILKTRYKVGDSEVDFFHHPKQICMAEFEFGDTTTMKDFTPYGWLGPEVTFDPAFSNGSLSQIEQHPLAKYEAVEALMDQIDARLAQSKLTLVVGIAGMSGSGKTTLANLLSERYNAPLIRVDDYNKGHGWLKQYGGVERWQNWDLPIVYDTHKAADDIAHLASQQVCEVPIYDFITAEPRTERRQVKPGPLLLVEGLYALSQPIYTQLDMAVFVEAEMTTRVGRRLLRDISRTPWPPEAILSYVIETAEPTCQQYVAPQKAFADLVVGTD